MVNYITTAEAAEILGVSETQMRIWHETGVFVPDHLTEGGHRRYEETEVRRIANRPEHERFHDWHKVKRHTLEEFFSGSLHKLHRESEYGGLTVGICAESKSRLRAGTFIIDQQRTDVEGWAIDPHIRDMPEGRGFIFNFGGLEKVDDPPLYHNLRHIGAGWLQGSPNESRLYFCNQQQVKAIYSEYHKARRPNSPWYWEHVIVVLEDEALRKSR